MRKRTFLTKSRFLKLFGSIFIISFSLLLNAKGFNLHGMNTLSDTPTGVIRALEVIDDTIFVAAENGLFKVIGGKSSRLALGNENFSGIVSSVISDNEGSLWIAEYGIGVYRYDIELGTVELIASDVDTSHVWGLVATGSDLYLSTIDSVIVIDKNTYLSHGANNTITGLSDAYVISLTSDNRVVVTNGNGIVVFDLAKQKVEHLLLSEYFPRLKRVSAIATFGDHIYIGGDSGLYKTSDLKGESEFLPFSSVSPPKRDIDFILEDSAGNVWLAAGGLYQVKNSRIDSVNWLHPLLINDSIRSILAIKETSTGDLLLASSQLGIVTLSHFHRSLNYIHREESLFQETIEDVEVYGDATANIKTHEALYSINLDSGLLSIEELLNDEGKLHCIGQTDIAFNSILNNLNGATDYCSNSLNHTVSIDSSRYYAYVHSEGSSRYYLVEDNEIIDELDAPDFVSSTLLSTTGELVGYDIYDNVHIQLSKRAWKEISSQDFDWKGITCLLENGTEFLICTSGSGLVSIDKISGEINKSNFFSQEKPRFIRAGLILDGYLWLATNKGLFVASLDGKMQRKLDSSDGIFDVDFEYGGIHQIDSKVLILGDRYNYLIEHAIAIEALELLERRTPTVKFFQLTKTDYLGSSVPVSIRSDGVEFSSDVFSINALVSSSDFLKHHNHKIQFNVLNYIDDWQTLDQSFGSILLSDLDYGDYDLSLRLIDYNSGRVFEQTTLPIKVNPPFYRTTGAYIFYFVIMIAVIWRTQNIRSLIVGKLVAEVNILRRFRKGELKSHQDRVESLMNDKARVFTNLSHELRTPLHLILGVIKKVDRNQASLNVETKSVLMRNLQRLESLTEQMVQLEKLEIASPNNHKTYNVDSELKLLLASLEPLAKTKKQTLESRLNTKAKVRLIDGSFEHIISNLITNAVKYSSEYSSIKVNASSNDKEVKITVSDSGIGIDPKYHSDIFKRFTRVNDDSVGGSGIGLAFVKELVTVNRGIIALESALGQGAKFIIRFPIVINESNEDNVEAGIVPNGMFPTILIVEDNLDLRGYLFDLLKTTYQCLTAKNGAQALDVLDHYKPDLVITDYFMTDMNGVSFVKELRKRQEHIHTPIVLLTAKADQETENQALEVKIDCVLRKPISDDELKSRIQYLLSIREHLKLPKQEEAQLLNSPPPSYLKIPKFNNEKDLNFYLKFIAVLEKNYKNEGFNRVQAADQMLISVRQLNRRLSELFEYNFTEFLSRYRIDKAIKALDKSGAIMDLSLDVGFGTPTYFSTTFKRVTGMPPKKFQDAFFGTRKAKNKA